MVSMGYKAVSTTTPAVPPAMVPSAKSTRLVNQAISMLRIHAQIY